MRAFICNNYEHYRKMRITREIERSLTAIALHDVQSVDSRPLRSGTRDGGDRSELPYTVSINLPPPRGVYTPGL